MTATPAIAFITHKTSKERAQASRSKALDEALSAINGATARHAGACRETRARWLAGSAFSKRDEVRAMMAPARVAYLLSRYPMTHGEMLEDEVLDEIRRRLKGTVAARHAGHWTFDRNRELALRNAYLAVRWARFLARREMREGFREAAE